MNSEVVGYRFPPDMTGEIVCTDPTCTMEYADLMATVAVGMTQDDIERRWDNAEGKPQVCEICRKPLDRGTAATAQRYGVTF